MEPVDELTLSGADVTATDRARGSILFVGTATVILRYAGFTILTDPNFLHRGDHVHLGHGMILAEAFERTLTSDDLPTYLRGLPAAGVPRVVVLDNAGLHVSKVVKAQRKELARRGIFLYFLPPYSPELNRIEPVFKQVKHHEISRRSHKSKAELRGSVEGGFETYGRKLDPKSEEKLRPAA